MNYTGVLSAGTGTTAGGVVIWPNIRGQYSVSEVVPASARHHLDHRARDARRRPDRHGDLWQPTAGHAACARFDDVNGNGFWETGEAPLPGVTVSWVNEFGATDTTVTTGTGILTWAGQPAGTYTVTQTLLPGRDQYDGADAGCGRPMERNGHGRLRPAGHRPLCRRLQGRRQPCRRAGLGNPRPVCRRHRPHLRGHDRRHRPLSASRRSLRHVPLLGGGAEWVGAGDGADFDVPILGARRPVPDHSVQEPPGDARAGADGPTLQQQPAAGRPRRDADTPTFRPDAPVGDVRHRPQDRRPGCRLAGLFVFNLTPLAGGATLTTVTDGFGNFRFDGVPAGALRSG